MASKPGHQSIVFLTDPSRLDAVAIAVEKHSLEELDTFDYAGDEPDTVAFNKWLAQFACVPRDGGKHHVARLAGFNLDLAFLRKVADHCRITPNWDIFHALELRQAALWHVAGGAKAPDQWVLGAVAEAFLPVSVSAPLIDFNDSISRARLMIALAKLFLGRPL